MTGTGRTLVVKFGGSVLRTGADLDEAARVVMEAPADARLVVVSAPFGLTDRLASLLGGLPDGVDAVEEASVLSYGERISARLFAAVLRQRGVAVRLLEPEDDDWPICTRGGPMDAEIDAERSQALVDARLRPILEREIVVLGGFLGREGDHVTTLRRGGSDTSALALAGFLGASDVVLVKSSSGVLSADPSVVPEARTIPELGARTLADLVNAGSPVVAAEALGFLRPENRLRVVSLGAPLLGAAGTWIRPEPVEPIPEAAPAIGSVTGVLSGRPGGLEEVLRVLQGQMTFALVVRENSVTVEVPAPALAATMRALHGTGAFTALSGLDPRRASRRASSSRSGRGHGHARAREARPGGPPPRSRAHRRASA